MKSEPVRETDKDGNASRMDAMLFSDA